MIKGPSLFRNGIEDRELVIFKSKELEHRKDCLEEGRSA
jgi:hypothetical protein